MRTIISTPKQALSAAFLRLPSNRSDIELFKKELIVLLDGINTKGVEVVQIDLLKGFLNAVYYKDKHYINTKHSADLVVHKDNNPNSSAFVLIRLISPANRFEKARLRDPIGSARLNVEYFRELLLCYLRDRHSGIYSELRYLIVTNVFEWFVFDAQDLETLFYQNKSLMNHFEQLPAGAAPARTHELFNNYIGVPESEQLQSKIPYTYFDIRDYEKFIRGSNREDDRKLIALYKFLSPVHLLKLPIVNDNNHLNREFYAELLHIIGLEEVTEDAKSKIVRKKENERNSGSIIENAIERIEGKNKWADVIADTATPRDAQSIALRESRQFEVALDLAITWINRILFLKLLESQILKYHKGNREYSFLVWDACGGGGDGRSGVCSYQDLDTLFFSVLARKEEERSQDIKRRYAHVPYLNSSLFEMTDMERKTICIDSLRGNVDMELYARSVLTPSIPPKSGGYPRSVAGKRCLRPVEYLLRFLDAYDFGSVGADDIQEDNKQLISSSVLGLIFEKINGYKDGSFFTPSFITMYMCRETIGPAVLEKFGVQTIRDLYNLIPQIGIERANEIVNQLRICDPAVGSGHFLVSALNELIRLKSELGILCDKNGKSLWNYSVTVDSDELIIRNPDGGVFVYDPRNSESQRVQETFFREKQTIIENCLFGVDINPNSVKICQLRLWIELLKHAYYLPYLSQRGESPSRKVGRLQTLPNIDINIRCGNSLTSRFALDDKYLDNPALHQSLKQATKRYKECVLLYKKCNDKAEKRQLFKDIEIARNFFYQINNASDVDYRDLKEAEIDLALHSQSFGFLDGDSDEHDIKMTQLVNNLRRAETLYREKTSGCFEWRFEFPEVLDDDGNFAGFDVVIGNPPYISAPAMVNSNPQMRRAIADSNVFKTLHQKWDLFVPFIERGLQLLSEDKIFAMIVPYPFTNQTYAKKIREFIVNGFNLVEIVDLTGTKVFNCATVSNCIPFIKKSRPGDGCYISHIEHEKQISKTFKQSYSALMQDKKNAVWNLTKDSREASQHSEMNVLGDICYISVGMVLNADEKTSKGEFAKDDLIRDAYDAIHCREYIDARDIERYRVKRTRYLEYNTARCPDKLRRPTFRELYDNPKLVINRLGNLTVYYDEDRKLLHSDSIFCAVLWKDLKDIDNKSINASVKRYSRYSRKEMELYSEHVDLRYLLGILNSNYVSALLSNMRGGDYHIYPEHVRNLPIPLVDEQQQMQIIALVDQIVASKKEQALADTNGLERGIDRLVYGLYGVTDKRTGLAKI